MKYRKINKQEIIEIKKRKWDKPQKERNKIKFQGYYIIIEHSRSLMHDKKYHPFAQTKLETQE